MFGLFGKLNEFIKLDEQRGFAFARVEPLYNLRLREVGNPFNAELLWRMTRVLADGISAEDTGGTTEKGLRLSTALSRHTAREYVKDEKSREEVEVRRNFSDVVIWIPRHYWDAAREEGSGPIRQLVTNLQLMHERTFSTNSAWLKRKPHYCVMPADDLQEDEVLCQYGMAVFIPDGQDRRLADLSIQFGQELVDTQLPDWIFHENGREVRRPAAWYAGQHCFVLALDRGLSCLPAPVWPADGKGSIRFYSKDQPLVLEAKPDSQHLRTKYSRSKAGGWEFEFEHLASREILGVLVEPAKTGADDKSGQKTPRGTGTIGGWPDSESPSLLLVGVALPSSHIKRFGIAGWQLFLHEQKGFVADPGDPGPELVVRLYGAAGDSALHWQAPGKPVEILAKFPVDLRVGEQHYSVDRLPGNADRFVLTLPFPETYNIQPETTYILGRNPPDIPARSGQESITLKLLDIPGSLLDRDGQRISQPDGTPLPLNNLISETQVELEWLDESLRVLQLSKHVDSLLLNGEGEEKEYLRKNTRARGYLLAGEYLAVGPYLFRLHPAQAE